MANLLPALPDKIKRLANLETYVIRDGNKDLQVLRSAEEIGKPTPQSQPNRDENINWRIRVQSEHSLAPGE
jgi:hypothetical protein